MIPVGYPQPGKDKSRRLLEAFVEGAGGTIADPAAGLQHSLLGCRAVAGAFYGTVGIEPLFRAAQRAGDWFYLDNSYFDAVRQQQFRISRNAMQRAGRADYARLDRLGLEIAPWRRSGRHIVIVEQSDYFMRELCDYPIELWREDVRRKLAAHTDRPIVVRPWIRDKAKASSSLAEVLVDAWALVTHASAAANEAVLAGVPVFVTGQSVALAMGLSQLEQIETPRRPDGRRHWAAQLAGSQFTEDEMRNGTAWRAFA
jgi:hypothetical protein